MLSVRKDQASDAYLATLLKNIEPKVRQAFAEAVNALKDPAVLDEVLRLLEQGQINAAMAVVERHITVFADKIIPFYTIAGQATAAALTGLIGVAVSFDQTNFRAVRIMQEARLRLIREFTNDQREAVRAVLVGGIRSGTNPLQQAKDIANIIGLSGKQAEAVANYRRLLEANSAEALARQLRDRRFDPTVENSIRGGQGLTQDQINRMVDRYAQRQIDFRARMIARTEALRAVHQANEEALQQAVDRGDLIPDDLIREWVTAHDEKVRGSHSAMDGQLRPFGESFISGDGNSLDYPGDPKAPAREVINCRCVLTTRLNSNP